MADGLPTLTIWQPWASLITLGVKTIETRGWAAPERLVGQRIGIHAAARQPDEGLRLGSDTPIATKEYLVSDGNLLDLCNNVTHPLPLGALLGTVRLAACVPMVGMSDPDPGGIHLVINPHDLWIYDDVETPVDTVTSQRPYGDFAAGRWAWRLEDPVPTTEQCPACDGKRWRNHARIPHGDGRAPCFTCDGAGRCDPIPAKGKQRLWYWRPERVS